MALQQAQTPNAVAGPEPAPEQDALLLIDEYLPRYDYATAHCSVLRSRPTTCYRAACNVDLLQDPIIRTLLGLRALPQRLADRLAGGRPAARLGHGGPTFRLDDMLDLGWILLAEEPEVELVFGQIGRPWQPTKASSGPAVTPDTFADFDSPGFAKIAFSLRVQPYGASSSILMMETRVALTDPESRRRFRRYWMLIGPFSSLIRRMALRLTAAELRRADLMA